MPRTNTERTRVPAFGPADRVFQKKMHITCQIWPLPRVRNSMEDSTAENSERTEGPRGHGDMSNSLIETPAHHIYDSIEMDQLICDGDRSGEVGTYVVVSEHGEEYLLAPIIPEVRRFASRADARDMVAQRIIEHRRAGGSVSIISNSCAVEGGCFMLHGKHRTITIEFGCRLSEAAYHLARQDEIRRDRIRETYNS